MYCPYVNCCCFFCTVWSTVNAPVQLFCTVRPYVNCLLFFLHCLSICKLFVVFLHCLSICKLLLLVFFCTVCPYVNCCCCFFCTVWSTLIRISLTKALVLWKPISGKNGTKNSKTKIPETHNLDAQTSLNYFEKKKRCYTMVNMPPSQIFRDL